MSITTDSEVRRGRVPRDTLSARVKLARDECGLSQRAAAVRCGLTFGEWQGIESGRDARGLDRKIQRIADGLGYDLVWLIRGGPLDHSGASPSRVSADPEVEFRRSSRPDSSLIAA